MKELKQKLLDKKSEIVLKFRHENKLYITDYKDTKSHQLTLKLRNLKLITQFF